MTTDAPVGAPASGLHLLLAEDDAGVRALFATMLLAAAGVGSVIEAEDSVESPRARAALHERRAG